MNPVVTKLMFVAIAIGVLLTLSPLRETGWARNSSESTIQQVRRNWEDIPPRERSRALENYRRFQKLAPERQRDIEERYHRWRELPSEEQDRIRENYRRYRGMNSDEKEEFHHKYRRWRSHPRD
ncbi:MAG: DUF3106 domain-containing protein [Deltaproteobacteria bacterium]|nr:DUF3106 domain-containing protein [Deltaproteobacteria bacterium]